MAALSARAAGENFPVALRILPRRRRRHLMAVYRFARLVDDIGDEPSPQGRPGPGDRLRALDELEADLDRGLRAPVTARHPVIREIVSVCVECAIPAQPLRMLIQANRQDQLVTRYPSFEDLLGYCRLSANPVGQMVLHIFDVATPERIRLSDLVCTALQLAEHWQDVAEDFSRGRVYLPQEDMVTFGCTEGDLAAAGAAPARGQPPPHLRELLRFETERAAALLDEGAPLTGMLRGWARLAVAGYVAGGRATLAAITAAGAAKSAGHAAATGFDVFRATPRPGRARTAAGLLRAYLTGR